MGRLFKPASIEKESIPAARETELRETVSPLPPPENGDPETSGIVNFDSEAVWQGMIYAIILGKPKAHCGRL